MGDVQRAIDNVTGKTKERRAERNAARARQEAEMQATAAAASARRAGAGQSMLTATRNEQDVGLAGDVSNSTMLTGKRTLGPKPF